MTSIKVPQITTDDAAWASFKTALTVDQVVVFCRDIERLFRINPYLEIAVWRSTDTNHFHFEGRNISQEPANDFVLDLTVVEQGSQFLITYAQGIKSSTTIKIESVPEGSQLTIIEDYSQLGEQERQQRLNEVDKSLLKWAGDLQMYLVNWRRWSRFWVWRWYMRQIWQPLKPPSRRIVYMLLWITVVEIAFIILGAGIYISEYR